jgi:hypothetical protein
MTNNDTAPWADVLDWLLTAANDVFPGPVLEKLIDRMESRT